MIHIRLVSPPDITAGLVDRLASNAGVFDLIVLEGVARNPDGDAVQFDVINAAANEVLQDLRGRGVAERGSIVIDDVGAALSERATAAEARSPRALNLSPVWEQAEARIRSGGRYPPSWFGLLAIAGLIAAVGIFTNSQILVVGAMVVGPEYAAIISVSLGINKSDHARIRVGLNALFVGFTIAVIVDVPLQRRRSGVWLGARALQPRHPSGVQPDQQSERLLGRRRNAGRDRRRRLSRRSSHRERSSESSSP